MSISRRAIVLGYGGSEHSKIALRWADRAAVDSQRPLLILVSVLDVADVPGVSDELAGARVVAELDTILSSAQCPNITVRSVLTAPGPALVREAADAHSLVLGARTRGPLASMVTGSVTDHVLRHAQRPVVIAREPRVPGAGRVVVGAHDAETHRSGLEFAFEYAGRSGSSVSVTHVVQDQSGTTEAALRTSVAELATKFPDVAVDITVQAGSPATVLAEISRDAALLVVGSHHRRTLTGLLTGSASQSLLQHAQCPLALVP